VGHVVHDVAREQDAQPVGARPVGSERLDDLGHGGVGQLAFRPGDLPGVGQDGLRPALHGPRIGCQTDGGVGHELAQDGRRQAREAVNLAVEAQVALAHPAHQQLRRAHARAPQVEHVARNSVAQLGPRERPALPYDGDDPSGVHPWQASHRAPPLARRLRDE